MNRETWTLKREEEDEAECLSLFTPSNPPCTPRAVVPDSGIRLAETLCDATLPVWLSTRSGLFCVSLVSFNQKTR